MSWKYMQYQNGKIRTTDEDPGGGGTVTDVEVNGQSVVNEQGVAEITMPAPPTIPVEDVKVNGTSVINDQNVAEIVSYKEVTQAEYNALPSSKLTDDIMYCIQDVGGSDSFPPLIYSDNEREVGVWKNGKPLYQRTVEAPTNLTQDETSCQWNISNIDEVCHVEGVGKWSDGYWFPVPMYHSSSNWACSIYNISSSGYSLFTGWNSRDRGISKIYITVQYTKTTDTAGSGIWTTQSGYAHHYSTTEQVIGTWIDGNTIYEKTYEFSSDVTINGNTWYDTPFSASGIDKVISIKAMNNIGSVWDFFGASCDESVIQLVHTRSTQVTIRYITIQYTKSSS